MGAADDGGGGRVMGDVSTVFVIYTMCPGTQKTEQGDLAVLSLQNETIYSAARIPPKRSPERTNYSKPVLSISVFCA